MLSHPMSLRSIIHLGLVGEMRMHNGKIPPHCRMEKEESNERMPRPSGFLPPRGLVLAKELEAAASGSEQLAMQGRGRSSRVPQAHDRSPCLHCV